MTNWVSVTQSRVNSTINSRQKWSFLSVFFQCSASAPLCLLVVPVPNLLPTCALLIAKKLDSVIITSFALRPFKSHIWQCVRTKWICKKCRPLALKCVFSALQTTWSNIFFALSSESELSPEWQQIMNAMSDSVAQQSLHSLQALYFALLINTKSQSLNVSMSE